MQYNSKIFCIQYTKMNTAIKPISYYLQTKNDTQISIIINLIG